MRKDLHVRLGQLLETLAVYGRVEELRRLPLSHVDKLKASPRNNCPVQPRST